MSLNLGCSRKEGLEQAEGELIEDDLGRQVLITAVPERIVSLSPATTENLFALGLGPRVVAGTEYDDYPPEALDLPKIGDYSNPNLEVVVSLEPDLVLADLIIHQKTIEDLERLGIPTLAFGPNTIEGVYNTLGWMGRAAGVPDEAEKLVADMQREVEALTAPLAELVEEDKPTVYYEIWHEPLITVGPNTFINDLLTLAGGRNIAADAQKDWPQYSLEVLVEADPQVIIRPRLTHGETDADVEDFQARRGWENISAVRERRIYFVEDDHISRAGPRLVKGLEELVGILHPDLYPSH
ncbi:MAG: ABC transporter substrate-binding protein [Firmicutes bacterium]|nr:ABC transporter substrate-binding protein [Bacillota bacterium]